MKAPLAPPAPTAQQCSVIAFRSFPLKENNTQHLDRTQVAAPFFVFHIRLLFAQNHPFLSVAFKGSKILEDIFKSIPPSEK